MPDPPRTPPPATHQVNVLIRMLGSRDPVERDVASRALRDLPASVISDALKDPLLASEAMDFFVHHCGSRPDLVAALRLNPGLPDALRACLPAEPGGEAPQPIGEGPTEGAAAAAPAAHPEALPGDAEDGRELTLAQRIQKMGVGEKVKMAMKGDKETRAILIKDTNREVYMSVLENPGLKEGEVEMLTKNTGTSTDILRAIGKNREWVSNLNIVKNLILNSKTPVEVSMRFLPRLSRKDLEFIEKSRNLPAAIRSAAKRMMSAKARE